MWLMVCKSSCAQSMVWICLGAFVYRQHNVCICVRTYVHPNHEPVASVKDWYRLHVNICVYLYGYLRRPLGRLGWLCGSSVFLKHVKHVYSRFPICSHGTPEMPLCLEH